MVDYRDTCFRNSKGAIVAAPALLGHIADTHAHLAMLADPALTLARCAAVHVDFIATVVDPSEPDETYALLETWQAEALTQLQLWQDENHVPCDGSEAAHLSVPHVRILLGVHPHNAKAYTPELEKNIAERAKDSRTSGIGEIGLDYHYDLSPREIQRAVFARQLQLAHELELPVALHLREAHDDGIAILRQEGIPQAGCVLHCFNLNSEVLQPFLDLGCLIAFGGPLTFKKSHEVREAATHVPLNRLLTETDAPYMTPEPVRGTVCGPEHTIFTAKLLYEVYSAAHPQCSDKEQFFASLYQNAHQVFDQVR